MLTASKSQAEIKLTIDSQVPVKVDKVKTDKHTDIQLDTGYMGLGFSF